MWTSNGAFNLKLAGGWDDLVHVMSHLIHNRIHQSRPHSEEHLALEWEMRRYVRDRGWLTGSLKKPEKVRPPKPKASLVERRKAKAERTLKKALRDLRSAERRVKKWRCKVRYYEKVTTPTQAIAA